MDCEAAIVTPAAMVGRTAVTAADWLPRKSWPPGQATFKIQEQWSGRGAS